MPVIQSYRDHPDVETRFLSSSKVQLRTTQLTTTGTGDAGITDADTAPAESPMMPMIIEGYAALYNTPVEYGGWVEYLTPGCFKDTLTQIDCCSSWNHSVDNILGRCSAGTLKLTEDEKGLGYECELANHYLGQYVGECVKRGDVFGLSIMFMVDDEDWDLDKEPYTRLIKKLSLYECGPVWQAASPECKVSLRAKNLVAEKRAAKLRSQLAATTAADQQLRREYLPLDELELRCRLLAL